MQGRDLRKQHSAYTEGKIPLSQTLVKQNLEKQKESTKAYVTQGNEIKSIQREGKEIGFCISLLR